MTELITTCAEREPLGKDRYRSTLHIKPIAFRDGSRLKRIKPDWTGGGLSARPHLIDEAPMIVSANNRGLRRVYPTRDMNVWVEIGAPRIQSGTRLQNMIRGNARRKGIGLSWADSRMNTITQMGGHFLEMKTELLNGWTPPGGKIAYEFKTRGLTRKGDVLFADGKPVMHLQQPVMTDLANDEGDTRPIKYEYVELGGKPYLVYVLPDLTGMKRPCVDPTLTLQPDAAAGKDNNLISNQSNRNYGVHPNATVGKKTGVPPFRAIWFMSLSSIDASGACDSATYTITNLASANQTAAMLLKLYCIKAANTGWVEGTKDGAVEAGSSCWNDHTYNSVQEWAGSVGCGTADTDYDSSELGSHSITDDVAGTTYDITLATAQVETWFGSDDDNHGVLNISDDESTDGKYAWLPSSDHATAAYRPKLVVVHTEAGGDAPFGRIFAPGFRGVMG